MAAVSPKKKVLFVCLGNTCRSPLAEAVFSSLVNEGNIANKWEANSAALVDWHTGEAPNFRTIRVLHNKGIKDYHHIARQVQAADFFIYDYIFGMDNDNIKRLNKFKPANSKASIALLGSFDPEGEKIIHDPYCDVDDQGFYKIYEQCHRSCSAFLGAHTY